MMPVVLTIFGYLLLPVGWIMSFFVLLSFWSPAAYGICKGLADGVYAASRKLRQAGRDTAVSRKANR